VTRDQGRAHRSRAARRVLFRAQRGAGTASSRELAMGRAGTL